MIKFQEKYALGVVRLLVTTQGLLLGVRKEFVTGENAFSSLREETDKLLDALRKSKEHIHCLKEGIEQRDADILARDTAITHFEEILSKITHRFAENERKHNKAHRDMSVQASVAVIEASTHADFLNVKPNKQSALKNKI